VKSAFLSPFGWKLQEHLYPDAREARYFVNYH